MTDPAATERSESDSAGNTRRSQPESPVELVPRESSESTQYLRERIHIATLEQEIETLRKERDEFAEQVQTLTEEVAALEDEVARLEGDLDRKDDQLDQIVTNYERILTKKHEQLQETGSSQTGLRDFLGLEKQVGSLGFDFRFGSRE